MSKLTAIAEAITLIFAMSTKLVNICQPRAVI